MSEYMSFFACQTQLILSEILGIYPPISVYNQYNVGNRVMNKNLIELRACLATIIIVKITRL